MYIHVQVQCSYRCIYLYIAHCHCIDYSSSVSVSPQHTSILEQHHCRAAKAVVREAGLLDHLPAHQRQEITSLMEELILSTDFTRHKTFMATFEVCGTLSHSLRV